MARVELTMQSVGVDSETCARCERGFKRGETMSAVVLEDSTTTGWWCDDCVDYWRRYGTLPA